MLTRCLASDPLKRYASADELKTELKLVRDRRGRGLAGPPLVYRVRKFLARNRLLTRAALASLVLAIAASLAFKLLENSKMMQRIANDSQQRAADKAVANQFVLSMIAAPDFQLVRGAAADPAGNLLADSTVRGYRLQWQTIRDRGGPTDDSDRAIYLIMASIFAAEGDFAAADSLLADTQHAGNPSPETVAIRQKIGEAFEAQIREQLARCGISTPLLVESNSGPTADSPASSSLPPLDAPLAELSLNLSRCLLLQQKHEESLKWCECAMGWYDLQAPDSLARLHAGATAVQCHTVLGHRKQRRALCRDLFYHFRYRQNVLNDELGFANFRLVVSVLNEMHSNFYGDLHQYLQSENYISVDASQEKMDLLFPPVPRELVPY